MTTVNPITGDLIKSKNQSENYRNNYDQIDWSIKEDKKITKDPKIDYNTLSKQIEEND